MTERIREKQKLNLHFSIRFQLQFFQKWIKNNLNIFSTIESSIRAVVKVYKATDENEYGPYVAKFNLGEDVFEKTNANDDVKAVKAKILLSLIFMNLLNYHAIKPVISTKIR